MALDILLSFLSSSANGPARILKPHGHLRMKIDDQNKLLSGQTTYSLPGSHDQFQKTAEITQTFFQGRKEQSSFDNFSGSIGHTRSTRYTEVDL
jgi:hypothetical protein